LAITEGRFGKPVKRSGRFINTNYPPEDVSQEELEEIWGDSKDFKDDIREAELESIRKKISSRKIKPY
jgi:hypothetical protein